MAGRLASWTEDRDKKEIPELLLNRLLVAEVFLQMLASGLGTIALIWATVVLLGGFSSALMTMDFWFVTAIVFVETAGVFAFLCLFATLKWSRLLKMTLLNFPKSKGAILDRHSIWMLYLMWTTPLLSFTGNENVHGLYDVLAEFFICCGRPSLIFAPAISKWLSTHSRGEVQVQGDEESRLAAGFDTEQGSAFASTTGNICYSMEVKDVVLPPWVVSGLCAAMSFGLTIATEPSSMGLNVALNSMGTTNAQPEGAQPSLWWAAFLTLSSSPPCTPPRCGASATRTAALSLRLLPVRPAAGSPRRQKKPRHAESSPSARLRIVCGLFL